MHDIEAGHTCPKCGSRSICTIEDGTCENGGTCDNCIKEEDAALLEQFMDAYENPYGFYDEDEEEAYLESLRAWVPREPTIFPRGAY